MLKMERRFKSAYMKRIKGKISRDQYTRTVDQLRFGPYKQRYYELSYDGRWLVYEPNSDSWVPAPPKIRKNTIRKRRLIASGVCFVLTLAMLFALPGTRNWIISISGASNPEYTAVDMPAPEQTQPAEPAYEAQLAEGITVKAPEGALTGDEVFSAEFLDYEQAKPILDGAGLPYPALSVFEFSAGMDEFESFALPVSLEVDLERAGIPVELKDQLVVYRIGDDGMQPQSFSIDGNMITIYTRKNCAFVLGAVLTGLIGILLVQEDNKKFGSQIYTAYRIPESKYSGYTIYWPISHAYGEPRDGSKIADIKKDLQTVLDRTGLSWSDSEGRLVYSGSSTSYYGYALKEAMAMEEYKRWESKLNDLNFLLKYVYPEKVAILVEYVMHAHDYLFDQRGFMQVAGGIDFVMRDPWPPDEAAVTGLSVDQVTKYPYVMINLELLQTDRELQDELAPYISRGLAASKINTMRSNNQALRNGNLDSLHGTVVHEMFHVIQEEYYNHIISDNLHFCEATAMLVESEAVAYYQKKGYMILKDYTMTDNSYYELMETRWGHDGDNVGPDGHDIAQRHGYTFYNVLKYNRDNNPLWKSDPDSFAKTIMEYYRSNSAPMSLAYSSYPTLMRDYAHDNFSAIMQRLDATSMKNGGNTVTLSATSPIAALRDPSAPGYAVASVRLRADTKKTGAYLILLPRLPHNTSTDWVGVNYSADSVSSSMRVETADPADGLRVLPAADVNVLISQDLTKAAAGSDGSAYFMEAYLAEPPDQPSVTYDDVSGEFVVKLPPESLIDAAGYRGRLIEIKSSNRGIKTYRQLVYGAGEVRIPIENIIYGSEEKGNLIYNLLAKAMMTAMRANLRMAMRMPIDEMTITESGGVFTLTRNPTEDGDDDDEVKFIDKSVSMAFETDEEELIFSMVTDKDYYLVMRMSMREMMQYLKYARSLFSESKTEYVKELEKYDSDFTIEISDVFSVGETVDADNIPSCANMAGQSAQTVAGPASIPLVFKGSGVDYTERIPPGTYYGRMFISLTSNIGEITRNDIVATVSADNTVSIVMAGETLAGKLAPSGKMGQYQFYERVQSGDGYKYSPVTGALATCSADGTLVFSFIPARLRRG